MSKLLMQKGFSTSGLIDYAASVESSRAMVTVINILSCESYNLIIGTLNVKVADRDAVFHAARPGIIVILPFPGKINV